MNFPGWDSELVECLRTQIQHLGREVVAESLRVHNLEMLSSTWEDVPRLHASTAPFYTSARAPMDFVSVGAGS